MKKKLITIMLAAVIAAVAMSALSACKKALAEKTVTAYGLVHTYYLGAATVTADKNSKVKDVKLDEYFLPHDWADKNNAIGYVVGDYVFLYNYNAETDTFTTTSKNTGSSQTPANMISISANTAELCFTKPQFAAYYVKQIQDNKCFILVKGTSTDKDYTNAAGTMYYKKGAAAKDNCGYVTMNKSDAANTYWRPASGLGYAGNMNAIIEYIKSDAFITGDIMGAARISGGDNANKWQVGGIVTGATAIDFKDYVLLAKNAYNLAIAEQHK